MSIEIANQKEIENAVNEIVNELEIIAGHQEQIKAILKDMKERFGVKPKQLRKIAKAISVGKTGEAKSESEEFAEMIEALAGD